MTNILRDISPSAVTMGALSAFVGFASSFAVVLQGLISVGASTAEAASGLMVLSFAMGLCGIFLSLQSRMPISSAWSTPGAAFLVVSVAPEGGFAVAVGAFVVSALAIIIAGLFKPLGDAVAKIPTALANALLGGILLSLCMAPFMAFEADPVFAVLVLFAWGIVGLWRKTLAVPAALIVFGLYVIFGLDIPAGSFSNIGEDAIPDLIWVKPEFTLSGIINIALPLFIITMASQNLTGVAVVKSCGYPVRPGYWFTVTGIFSLVSAPFGGHGVNLAAITAAMCAGVEAHEDPKRRYWAAIIAGIGYCIFGLLAGAVTAFVSLAPVIFVQAVAGLALIGAFARATQLAFEPEETREAAAVTFLMTASGATIFGISGAFWGLVAGGTILMGKRIFTNMR